MSYLAIINATVCSRGESDKNKNTWTKMLTDPPDWSLLINPRMSQLCQSAITMPPRRRPSWEPWPGVHMARLYGHCLSPQRWLATHFVPIPRPLRAAPQLSGAHNLLCVMRTPTKKGTVFFKVRLGWAKVEVHLLWSKGSSRQSRGRDQIMPRLQHQSFKVLFTEQRCWVRLQLRAPLQQRREGSEMLGVCVLPLS